MIKNYLLTAYGVYMRRKLFTAINLLCISLTLMILLVVTALLQNTIHPGGVERKSDRLLEVHAMSWTQRGDTGRRSGPLGYKVIDKYLRTLKSVERVAAVTRPITVSVYQPGKVTELMLRRADAEYWQILEFEVLAGNLPNHHDVAQGRFVLAISESAAGQLFDQPNQAIGQRLNIGGQSFEVIGVVADVSQLDAMSDLWAPVTTYPSSDYREQLWGDFSAVLLARDAAGVAAIKAEVEQVTADFAFDDPARWQSATLWADSKLDALARSILGQRGQDSGAGLLLAVVAGLMLLFMLLPALNLVNLNIGRILERSSEIGVRKAFGASSNQLVLQLIVENILLSLLGGLLALVLTKGALLWLEGSGLIPYLKVEINLPVFVCGLLISAVFGLLSGVIPAWKTSRLDPVLALKGAF